MAGTPTRVLVAVGDAVLRQRLLEALSGQVDIEVVAEAGTGRAALGALVAHAPDVLVCGVDLPDLGAAELEGIAQRNHPGTAVVIESAAAEVVSAIRRAAPPR